MGFSFHNKTLKQKGQFLEKIKLTFPDNHDVKGEAQMVALHPSRSVFKKKKKNLTLAKKLKYYFFFF